MTSRKTILGSMVLLAVCLLLIDIFLYSDPYIERLILTVIALAVIYLLFKLILEDRLIGRLADYKIRYYYSKTASIAYLLVVSATVLAIWIENVQALLLGFGLIAAAFTITIQDVARNFVGGIAIFVSRIYSVGDRIEVMGKQGDVLDIGLLYTTVMEIGNWVNADQPTGRLSVIPNGHVLNNMVNNYTRDFEFIWDELTIPVTYDSDWREAVSLIMDVLREQTGDLIDQSQTAIPLLEHKYFFSGKSTEPAVFVRLTDNWIELSARFVTDPRRRRIITDSVSRSILRSFDESGIVKIASQTFEIVGFPEVRLGGDGKNRTPGDRIPESQSHEDEKPGDRDAEQK